MYVTKNPVIVMYQFFAVTSVIVFPLLFMLVRQQLTDGYPFILFVFSCLIGLICSFTLLLRFELPKFAFPGIAIHLFSLFIITCC